MTWWGGYTVNMTTNQTTLSHIRRIDLLAVSGGRVKAINENTITLPVSSGYHVDVEYMPGHDLYEVRRVYVRAAKRNVKALESHLYADMLSDAVYRASCFRNEGMFGA